MEKIDINDFAKIELKVGEIISCEDVEDSYKLYKFQIDLGNETRQILSGLKKYYKKEELIGQKVAVVTNLKTAKIAGLESDGMLLTALISTHKAKIVEMSQDIPNGTIIC